VRLGQHTRRKQEKSLEEDYSLESLRKSRDTKQIWQHNHTHS